MKQARQPVGPPETFRLWAVVDDKIRLRINELGALCVYVPKHAAVREARHASHVSNKAYEARRAVLVMDDQSLAAAGPELVWVSNGEAGDGQNVCSECGMEMDSPHTWKECIAEIKAQHGRDRAITLAAHQPDLPPGQAPALVALSRAYSAASASLSQCREVMQKINDNEQQCPICHGKRQMEPTMEWGWIPGAIKHRKGCIFLVAMGACECKARLPLLDGPKGVQE